MRHISSWLKCIGCVFIVSTVARAQDIDERFAKFLLEWSQINEGFSVTAETISFTDQPIVNDDGTRSKTQREEFSLRTIKRMSSKENGKWRRLDGMMVSLLDDEDTSISTEAQLIKDKVGLNYSKDKWGPPQIVRFEVKGGHSSLPSMTRFTHPFSLATEQASGFLSENGPTILSIDHVLLSEAESRDGRTELLTYGKSGAGPVYRFRFSKDEDWRIEDIEFMCSRKWEASGVRIDVVTNDMLPDYRIYATNRTEWKQINERWVPIKTTVISDIRDRKKDIEIRYLDWKFKDELDEKLFEESEFTIEKIPTMINFDELAKRFEKL